MAICLQDYPNWYDINKFFKSRILEEVYAPHPTQTQERRYDRRGDSLQPDILVNRLHQFKQSGLFEKINGILIGYAKEVDHYPVEDIFLEVTEQYNFPILKTDDFGHHCPNTVLPVGVKAALDPITSTLELIEPCVK